MTDFEREVERMKQEIKAEIHQKREREKADAEFEQLRRNYMKPYAVDGVSTKEFFKESGLPFTADAAKAYEEIYREVEQERNQKAENLQGMKEAELEALEREVDRAMGLSESQGFTVPQYRGY